jgi:FMN phosphatase YigB (HAD superfamily)
MDPDDFMAHLMQAVALMLANDGSTTNEEVFSQSFYPLAGQSREEVEPVFENIYRDEHPSLRDLTRRKPEARQVVQLALDLGYGLVVATNPLFPAVATMQRLEWAGVADLPFRLVTTYENSRAVKPNLPYFEQVLETIGQPAAAALVVGDEDMDMVAAHLGCATFLIPGPRTELAPTTPAPIYEGTLADVASLLDDWGPVSA